MIKFIFKIERYKWNKEYGVYVSNLGHFKDRHKRLIAPKINQNGYLLITTEVGIKLAHRLVMFTFCPVPNAESLTVDHLDHNKRRNELSNLEWVDKEENLRRAIADLYVQYNGNKKSKKRKDKTYYVYDVKSVLLYTTKDIEEVSRYIRKKDNSKVLSRLSDQSLKDKIYNIANSNKVLKNKRCFNFRIDFR